MTKPGYYATLSREEKDRRNKLKRSKYDPAKQRDLELKRRYGIGQSEFEALLESQSGVCAICSCVDETQHGWHVDHDHATGKVRGILCHHCNAMLGQAQDSIDRLLEAIHYLKRNQRG